MWSPLVLQCIPQWNFIQKNLVWREKLEFTKKNLVAQWLWCIPLIPHLEGRGIQVSWVSDHGRLHRETLEAGWLNLDSSTLINRKRSTQKRWEYTQVSPEPLIALAIAKYIRCQWLRKFYFKRFQRDTPPPYFIVHLCMCMYIWRSESDWLLILFYKDRVLSVALASLELM